MAKTSLNGINGSRGILCGLGIHEQKAVTVVIALGGYGLSDDTCVPMLMVGSIV